MTIQTALIQSEASNRPDDAATQTRATSTAGALPNRFDDSPAAPERSDELLHLAMRRRDHPPAGLIRAFDLATAGAGLVLLAPLIAVIGLVVVVVDGRPFFFRQRRIGRFGQPFDVFKIRTMKVDADRLIEELLEADAELAAEFTRHRKLKGDPRLTKTGSFLRRSRLDELPQLISVIRGDMSVVGPRPVVPSEIRRYGGFASVAFSVRPGVTGRWQVLSSNAEDYEERVLHDVKFGTHHTFRDVIGLALRTPAVMLKSLRKQEFV